MNVAAGYLYHLLVNNPRQWHPLLSVYYLTYACAFRCPYCSDGAGKPYWALPASAVTGAKALELLRAIRRHCDYVVITGGEPLQHPDFAEVMRGLPGLKFKGVILTTSGHLLEQFLEDIAPAVHDLGISVDTLDPAKSDAWHGTGAGTHQRILDNIERAARLPGRRFEIIISSVVTPENLEDLPGVYRYATERGFKYSASPQLVGVKARRELAGLPAYREFYDFLIAEKRRGGNIHGTVDYLEFMRDLRQFRCRPFTMLAVAPAGDVFYPCLEIGRIAGNLLQESSLHRLRQNGLAKFGPPPMCGNQCHSPCALGFARLLANPASLLHEGFLLARARFKMRR